MTTAELESYAAELRASYPGCHLKTAPDQCELVAEISPELAVAIIERSQPHFHRATTEVYRVLKGTLLVARAGMGVVLQAGEEITLEPGQIHQAFGHGEPAWIEVISSPPWCADDHFVVM
jgi:mannose-6-phosphate isomerase-like protein (cupin superfamily)